MPVYLAMLAVHALNISVDYAIHVLHAFLLAHGTKVERAQQAVGEMGTAVVHGAISTFLAVIVLAGSESLIFVVFFKMFFGTFWLRYDKAEFPLFSYPLCRHRRVGNYSRDGTSPQHLGAVGASRAAYSRHCQSHHESCLPHTVALDGIRCDGRRLIGPARNNLWHRGRPCRKGFDDCTDEARYKCVRRHVRDRG
jgi:hypothetical protein